MMRKITRKLVIFSILLIFILSGISSSLQSNQIEESKYHSFYDFDDNNRVLSEEFRNIDYNVSINTQGYFDVLDQTHYRVRVNDPVEEYLGYIIQLQNNSLYKYYLKLIQKSTFCKLNQCKRLHEKLKEYESKLLKSQQKVIDDIKKTLHVSNIEEKIQYTFSDIFNGISLNITDLEASKISNIDGIKKIYPNYQVKACLDSSIRLIGADQVWQMTDKNGEKVTGKNITIAIIDTGIDYNHSDLGGGFGDEFKVIGGFDFVNNDSDPMDDNGHGTHCAGIVSGNGFASGGQFVGVAPDANLYAYKSLDKSGVGWLSQVIAAVERAIDPNNDNDLSDHVDIISMSLGSPRGVENDPLCQSVDLAVDLGIVVTVSAGNNGPSEGTINSPGCAKNVITVGASTHLRNSKSSGGPDCVTWYSSRGPTINGTLKPDIVAPGGDCNYNDFENYYQYGIISCRANHTEIGDPYGFYYRKASGTSMACPHVAGVIALLKQMHPSWSPDEIKMALRSTAKKLNYSLNVQGYGRVDALESVLLDQSPPIALLKTCGIISGLSSDIIGSAMGNGFKKYSLFYKKGWDYNVSSDSEINWIKICESQNKIDNDILSSWNIGTIIDGEYTLKLLVESTNGIVEDRSYITIQNTEIIYPKNVKVIGNHANMKIFPSWRPIEIIGTCQSSMFDYYALSWSFDDKNEWNTTGISLNNNGLEQIENAELGIWNTSFIQKPGYYALNLTMHNLNDETSSAIIYIYIDPDLMQGWPLEQKEWYLWDPPVIEDIDNDGKNDIISANYYTIFVYRYDGKNVEGWPREISTWMNETRRARFYNIPSVGDIDDDGYNEIISLDSAGYLHVFNWDGSYKNGWPKKIAQAYTNSIPCLADINNDGLLDIIFGDFEGFNEKSNNYLHVIDINGNHLEGWPKFIFAKLTGINMIENPPVVADIDKDGFKEIVVSVENIYDTEQIWIFNHDGSLKKGWPKRFEKVLPLHSFYPRLVLADVNNDTYLDIVYTNTITDINKSYEEMYSNIYVWNHEGKNVDGWPQNINSSLIKNLVLDSGICFKSPSISDVNVDGYLEIIVSDECSESAWVFKHDGSIMKNWPKSSLSSDYKLFSDPDGLSVIGNLESDKNHEFINSISGYRRSTYYNEYLPNLYAFNSDGSIPVTFPKKIDGFTNEGHAISDLDADGDTELIVISQKFPPGKNLVSIDELIFNVYIWDLETKAVNNTWNQFFYNAQHTGSYPIKEPYVRIVRPLKGYFSIGNIALFQTTLLKNTIIIGNPIIQIGTGETTEKIELFINDQIQKIFTERPYEWKWNQDNIGKQDIKVIAYGENDGTAIDQFSIIKLL